MVLLGRISKQIALIKPHKLMTVLLHPMSSVVLQHNNVRRSIAYKSKGTIVTSVNQCELRRCHSNIEDDEEYLKFFLHEDVGTFIAYKEVVKELSFKVPSFGGSVWVNSPFDIRVRYNRFRYNTMNPMSRGIAFCM